MKAEILTALIGASGIVLAALIGYFATIKERYRRRQSEAEMSLQMAALDFSDFLSEWHETHNELSTLMKRTNVDRFLILRAWNGHLAPKWTTAIYQVRSGEQKTYSYVHYELDQDYVERLRYVNMNGCLYFKTEDLPECGIKDVYHAEGVTGSLWLQLEERWVQNTSSRAITYCSFSTHHPEGLNEDEITQCKILAGRLKGMAMAFGNGDDK